MKTKLCSKCKVEKLLFKFHKDKSKKSGYRSMCKSCAKQYYKDNAEHILKQQKQCYKDSIEKKKHYYENNICKIKQYRKDNAALISKQKKRYRKDNNESITKYNKQWRENNSKYQKQYNKQYRKNNVLFAPHSIILRLFEEIQPCPKNNKLLEVKCTYCGKWLLPTNLQVQHRLQALNGKIKGECRFYCSEACKHSCPTYRQQKYWKGQNEGRLGTSREVAAWFRQLVLETDNWTCQKCGNSKEKNPELTLHVHHINGVAQQPLLQNDIDNAITLCIDCHKEVHKKEGCTYFNYRRFKCGSVA